jgi:KUP system potassium uptake protein
MSLSSNSKISAGSLLIALGIIYGDIGTSPLYVMKALIGSNIITQELVLGGVSCVIWTITLLTTFKYVILILKADNKGEGGIFSLFSLIRKEYKFLSIVAIIGGCTLLADGMITPPISIASAVEGIKLKIPTLQTVPVVLAILCILFFFQRFGTNLVGKAFGPVMLVWFVMIAGLGTISLLKNPAILNAFSPIYAYNLLVLHPGGFYFLGAIFLCTTGAEALYSDLGHAGKGNIRVSWGFVKICLLLNYLGQGAWLLKHQGEALGDLNPFYKLMAPWMIVPGVIIATLAAIIASQALISGSFTLISEAVRLHFWPKMKINYPTEQMGQLYVPGLNTILFLGCVFVVLYFQESSHMEHAYGLSITLTMIMTTILFTFYMIYKKMPVWFITLFVILFLVIEFSFLYANVIKFFDGGYVTLFIAGILFFVMLVWSKATSIKGKLTDMEKLAPSIPLLQKLRRDDSITKIATHLVYLTSSERRNLIDKKIIASIIHNQPKRADIYWFVHVNITDEPYTMNYKVHTISKNEIIRVDFNLGFRIEQRIHLYLRKVIVAMLQNKEIEIDDYFEDLGRENHVGDFKFMILERYLSYENQLPFFERLMLESYFYINKFTITDIKWFGLENSSVEVEKVPLILRPRTKIPLIRIDN